MFALRRRVFNSVVAAGVGNIILAVLPFLQAGNQMNITSWALVFVGVVFVLWGLFKQEHRLSPREAADLLESRKQYLPKLKNNVLERTRELERVRDAAGSITFSQYLAKYYSHLVKGTNATLGPRASKITVAQWTARIGRKAILGNLYYEDLKQRNLSELDTEYDLLIALVKDRRLKKYLKDYWDVEDMTNSRHVFAQMMKNDRFPIRPQARNIANVTEKLFRKHLKIAPRTRIVNRIDELLNGEADE